MSWNRWHHQKCNPTPPAPLKSSLRPQEHANRLLSHSREVGRGPLPFVAGLPATARMGYLSVGGLSPWRSPLRSARRRVVLQEPLWLRHDLQVHLLFAADARGR